MSDIANILIVINFVVALVCLPISIFLFIKSGKQLRDAKNDR
jgi:hypothetical protein